jgi:deoxyribose-phosphate aldolase
MEQFFEEFENKFKLLKPYQTPVWDPSEGKVEALKQLFSFIDLTTLNTTDSTVVVETFCNKVAAFPEAFPGIPNVAALCVYPVFASVLKARLRDLPVKRAVVSAGFPSSQTFLDLKVRETRKALEMGANEIDIVISVGEFLEGNHEFVLEEIKAIKAVMGSCSLKVILETGVLKTDENIWNASLLAMEGGADFIKTSTGKLSPAATPEAVWVMAHAIRSFQRIRNRKVGIKAAGGIVTSSEALVYYQIVKELLGDEWITPQRFRIGASRLANNLLTDIVGSGEAVKHF